MANSKKQYAPNADGMASLVRDFCDLMAIVAQVTSFRIAKGLLDGFNEFVDESRRIGQELIDGKAVSTSRIRAVVDRGGNTQENLEAVFRAFLKGAPRHFDGLVGEVGVKAPGLLKANKKRIEKMIVAYKASLVEGFELSELAPLNQEIHVFLMGLRQQAHKEMKDREAAERAASMEANRKRGGQAILAALGR